MYAYTINRKGNSFFNHSFLFSINAGHFQVTSQIWGSFQAPFQSAVRASERFFSRGCIFNCHGSGKSKADALWMQGSCLLKSLPNACCFIAELLQSCCRFVAGLLLNCSGVVAELLQKHGRLVAKLRNNPARNPAEIAPTRVDSRSSYKTHIPAAAKTGSIRRNLVF
jgi:hypothetical protein